MALATMVTCLSTSAFAEDTTEINNYVKESNYLSAVEEYEKYSIGDVVTFDDGMQFVVWSNEVVQSEDDPNYYYVLTKYIENVPGQEINYACDNILDAVPLANSGITPYFSAVATHPYNNKTEAVTILTRFMYDGENYPSVYTADYRCTNGNLFKFSGWDNSKNIFTKSFTNILKYEMLSGLGYKPYSVSVTCKKDGTQG